MRTVTLALVLCALAACAGTPRADTLQRPGAIASGLPLGCVPSAQSQRCEQFGAYYSGDDLRRTGAQHVGQALTLLDPQLGH